MSWRPKTADVKVTGEGRSGRSVEADASAKAIDAAVRRGAHRIKLRVKDVKPAVSAAAARKIDRLIGTFTTQYVAGQPRVTNIRRMARTVDGTIVAPGAQFSLNGRVGQRTKDGGYVEAPFIADGKLEPSVGGGVSQFSTTLYNAAFFGGLKIDTHTPHSIFISRYPPGRESTLNYDSIDLKWTNDTDAPVLIRQFTDESSVTVSLYGDNGGRRVQRGDRASGSRSPVRTSRSPSRGSCATPAARSPASRSRRATTRRSSTDAGDRAGWLIRRTLPEAREPAGHLLLYASYGAPKR